MARRPVAVLLSRFPLVTETFILREVIEMERQGQPVLLAPLLHERPRVVHREALPWMDRALQAPLLSAAVLAANLRALRRRPGRVLRLLVRLLAASAGSPNFLLRTLALFPKSVWLAERLEAEGAAHLHAHFATHPASMALIVSALTGLPWSLTVHAHDIFVRQAMLRDKLAAARLIRAISRFNRELLEERYPGEVGDKVLVIHVGIDPEVYRRLPPPPEPGTGPLRILCVAAHRPYKGLPVLLDACRLLADEGLAFRCEIVGDGPLRPELEQRIAELDLTTVHLRGALPQDEVTRCLGEAAVFVLPSIVAPDGQMEGIPVALMEAMAAGRPVVASALSGIPELVEDGVSGFLVPPGDAPGIAAALRRLLAEPELGRRMGERGRVKVDREFRLDRTVADLLSEISPSAEAADPEVADLLARAGLDGAGVRRVHRRMDSVVIEALAPGPRDLVLKVQRSRPGESRPAPERARHEFEVLSCLHRRFAGEPGSGVPRPLRLVEDAAAVLMERCAGRCLVELVRRGRAARGPAWEELVAALRQAGGWLRLFQQHTRRDGDGEAALEKLLARTTADLAACRERRLLPSSLAGRVEEGIDQLRQGIDSASLPRVGHHGDLWPGNLYIDGDGSVQVIDFEGYRDGLPWEDAAYFLVELELFFAWPGLGRRRERAAAAFLAGWASAGPPPDLTPPAPLSHRPPIPRERGELAVPLAGTFVQERVGRGALELCRLAKALRLLARTGDGRSWRRRRALLGILRRAGGPP